MYLWNYSFVNESFEEICPEKKNKEKQTNYMNMKRVTIRIFG